MIRGDYENPKAVIHRVLIESRETKYLKIFLFSCTILLDFFKNIMLYCVYELGALKNPFPKSIKVKDSF